MALDEPHDDDTRTTVEGFDFLVSRTDAQMIPPGCELELDYADGAWSRGFYVSTGYGSSCGIP